MKKAVAGLATVGVALALATSASAEVLGTEGGFTYVKREKTLANGPGPQEANATAKCPDGSVRMGGGATVTGKATGTFIASSGTATDSQWFAEGWHTGVNSENEKLTTWLVCTEKAGKVSIDTQLENVGAGPAGGNSVAECSDGHAVGGGARLIGATQSWWLNSTAAVDLGDPGSVTNDGWVSWAEHPSGPATQMLTDVICMTGKEPTYRSKQKTTDKSKVGIKVFCPKGKSVTGGGAFASGATDQAHIVLTAPIDSKKDSDKVPDDGWKAKYFNDAGENQGFSASAVCK